jgi:hypothetical protein
LGEVVLESGLEEELECGFRYVAEIGKISSHVFIPFSPSPSPSSLTSFSIGTSLSFPTQASHIVGFSPTSLLPPIPCLPRIPPKGGGIHVPFRMASSMRAWWRLRRTKERMTIAPETPSRRTSVARNVYRYSELELWRLGPVEVEGGLEGCDGEAGGVDWETRADVID